MLLTTLETLVSKIPLCLLQNKPRIYFAVLSDCVDDVLYIFHFITSGMYLSRGLAFIAKSMHDFYKENVHEKEDFSLQFLPDFCRFLPLEALPLLVLEM